MPDKEFNCARCGKCCRSYFIPVSEEDILRWSIQFRSDILERISPHDMAFQPVKTENGMQCPFLKELPYGKTCICCIHNTKPNACRTFPLSIKQAKEVNCPGLGG